MHNRATNFRMNQYRDPSRPSDLDDEEPFANEPQMEVNVTRHDSFNRNRDMEAGYGGNAIAVTTKIEQEVNARS